MSENIRRGAWLTGFLILALISSIASPIMYLFMWQKLISIYPVWELYILASIGIFRIFSILAIWFWSKSGVVAYTLLSIIALVISLILGVKLSLLGLIGNVILIIIVFPKWRYMVWSISSEPKVSYAAQQGIQPDT